MDRNWKSWIQLALGFGLTVLFFYMMAPFLIAILLGAITCIIWYPVHECLNRKCPKSLSAFLVTMSLSIGILLPLLLVLYSGSYKLLKLVKQLQVLKDSQGIESWLFFPWLRKLVSAVGRFVPVEGEWFREQMMNLIQTIAEKSYGILAGTISGMPGLFIGFIVLIVSFYFFLLDGETFLRFLSKLSPLPEERSSELYHTFEKSCRGVVIGLFLSAFAQGLLMTLFFLFTSLPNPILFGAISVGMGMVPIIGTAPIWIGGTIYLFSQSSIMLGVVMLTGGVLISVIDNLIRGWIMHGTVKMHPLLALVSVFGAINLVGASGIFLGPIIAAVFVSFLKILSQENQKLPS